MESIERDRPQRNHQCELKGQQRQRAEGYVVKNEWDNVGDAHQAHVVNIGVKSEFNNSGDADEGHVGVPGR